MNSTYFVRSLLVFRNINFFIVILLIKETLTNNVNETCILQNKANIQAMRILFFYYLMVSYLYNNFLEYSRNIIFKRNVIFYLFKLTNL